MWSNDTYHMSFPMPIWFTSTTVRDGKHRRVRRCSTYKHRRKLLMGWRRPKLPVSLNYGTWETKILPWLNWWSSRQGPISNDEWVVEQSLVEGKPGQQILQRSMLWEFQFSPCCDAELPAMFEGRLLQLWWISELLRLWACGVGPTEWFFNRAAGSDTHA